MAVLRDIFRRRGRALLTIFGVSIGVLALVVMGALVERGRLMVSKIDDGMQGLVIVADEKDPGFIGMGGTNPLPPQTIAGLHEVEGVRGVHRLVQIPLDDAAPIAGVVIQGWDPLEDLVAASAGWVAEEGRLLREDDRGCAVIGSDLVEQLDAEVGGTVELRGRTFEVVGVLERTFMVNEDLRVVVPMADAQSMFFETLPEAFRARVEPAELALIAVVDTVPGADADDVARAIERDVKGVVATGPDDVTDSIGGTGALIDLVTASVGVVALLVGALSVVNTMLVSVLERRYEVGVKRGLGASSWRVARDVLTESATMTLLGGAVGIVAGSAVSAALNAVTGSAGMSTWFLVTPRLVAGSVAFAVVLGLLGGAYPARYAARLDPIDALGHE